MMRDLLLFVLRWLTECIQTSVCVWLTVRTRKSEGGEVLRVLRNMQGLAQGFRTSHRNRLIKRGPN